METVLKHAGDRSFVFVIPVEQAYPLLFLCSDAARSISGQTLVSDAGYLNAGVTRAYPPAEDVAKFLLGKFPIPEA